MAMIYLHKDDLVSIQKFMDAFPDSDMVQLNADSSSGIGTILTATLNSVLVNDNLVSVSKTIVDESSW
jgi:hypothetical protein